MIQEKKKFRNTWTRRETYILQLFCLSRWVEQFQKLIEDFIQETLVKAANIMAVPAIPVKKGEDIICLHSLQCLVAGTIQEEELVQQPNYAFTYAKLDRAIIWDGHD
ncbi:hypothetical protein EI94DRAFT_1707973 [Lactarius quietus]|nr:hypothetical protein EI94DRAFT_1707973 [Lactarius quietus]